MPVQKAADCYRSVYGTEAAYSAFTPYRVCPVGAHVDHQGGRITGMAIDRGVRLFYQPAADDAVELRSVNFSGAVNWRLREIPERPCADWADHLRGAALMLRRRYPLQTGLLGVLEGELPIGGLSSSAAVILTFLSALCRLNGIRPGAAELIDIAKQAENEYVGVSCGTLDQSCEVLCEKDRLLYLDTVDGSYSLIPAPETMKKWKIAVFFSGLERSLAGSAFNMRVDECRCAAYALQAYAGLPYGKVGQARLRDVPHEIFLAYADRLPEPWCRRARHYYEEQDRVVRAAQAWKNGDLDTYGEICFDSGRSSIENYETGSPELKTLYEIMRRTDGIYGGRFSGAGFKGCCMAIIDPDAADDILPRVKRDYLAAFPQLADKYAAAVCESADGLLKAGVSF